MTSEERAVLIAEKLALNKNDPILWDKNLANWLSSPDGIAAVKARMIDRGYDLTLSADHGVLSEYGIGDNTEEEILWFCGFTKGGVTELPVATSEAEAVLSAAEKALRAENLVGIECKCKEEEPAIVEDKGDYVWRYENP